MGQSVEAHRDIDRGWAWVVMISSYTGMVIYCVPLYMSGVLYIALLDRFKEGEAKTSLIGAVSSGLLCFAAPVGGVINNRFSCRVSIVLGGALTTTGFATSAFAPSLDWMIVTSGILVGLGFATSSSGLICVVGFYFEKWRNIVISCAFLTVGLAMFISAPFGIYLITEHGLSATFLILACIQAQMCVCGMLSKPSAIEQEVNAQKKRDRMLDGSKSKTYLDVTLMKNASYTCYLLTVSTWNFGLCVAIMHLPNYVSVLGGTNREIGLIMTSFSVANAIGRLFGSYTISKLNDKSLFVYAGVLGTTGLATSLFGVYADLAGGTYIFAIQLGIFTGWPNAMMTPLSLDFVGVYKLSEAYGLAYVFCGLGVSTGPVLIGYLYILTGSYKYSFVVAGAVLCLGCLFSIFSICCKSKPPPNDRKTEFLVISKDKSTYRNSTVTKGHDTKNEISESDALLDDRRTTLTVTAEKDDDKINGNDHCFREESKCENGLNVSTNT